MHMNVFRTARVLTDCAIAVLIVFFLVDWIPIHWKVERLNTSTVCLITAVTIIGLDALMRRDEGRKVFIGMWAANWLVLSMSTDGKGVARWIEQKWNLPYGDATGFVALVYLAAAAAIAGLLYMLLQRLDNRGGEALREE